MGYETRYLGVNFNNLRKALYLLFFGVDNGKCNSFESEKYQYIIPMQGNFENPLQLKQNDTYIQYWIEQDTSLTRDDYIQEGDESWNRQKCVATVLLRFIGVQAEDWAKSFRHLYKRKGVVDIWNGVLNAEKLEYTSPIIPRKVYYSGLNSQTAFDLHIKLYYDEVISTGWKPLTGVNLKLEGNIKVEGNSD